MSYAPNESERPALEEAADFLRGELTDGECEVVTLKSNARAAGISEITLRRAKERLGVKARKIGFSKNWVWYLASEGAQGHSEGAQEIDDEHLRVSDGNKTSYDNSLVEGAHGNNSEHLRAVSEQYREPTKEELAAAAKDPVEWDRLVTAAEREEVTA